MRDSLGKLTNLQAPSLSVFQLNTLPTEHSTPQAHVSRPSTLAVLASSMLKSLQAALRT